MSVAEQLKAEGWVESLRRGWKDAWKEGYEQGLQEGRWMGGILMLEDFLEKPSHSLESLELLTAVQLEALHAELQREYENCSERN